MMGDVQLILQKHFYYVYTDLVHETHVLVTHMWNLWWSLSIADGILIFEDMVFVLLWSTQLMHICIWC